MLVLYVARAKRNREPTGASDNGEINANDDAWQKHEPNICATNLVERRKQLPRNENGLCPWLLSRVTCTVPPLYIW